MNKLPTLYLMAILLSNAALGLRLPGQNAVLLYNYKDAIGVSDIEHLPDVTAWAINFAWWPFLIAAAAGIAGIFSVATRGKSLWRYHVVIGLLAIDSVLIFLTLIGHILPLLKFPPTVIQ